jgi:F0F1-type ATP synthase assembly protein I
VPDGRAASSKWLRYSSLGLELGAAVAVPTLLGAWIDRRWGSEPWGFLAGFCLGIGGGLYRFIRTAMAAMRQAEQDDRSEQNQIEERDDHERPG